MRLLGLLFGIPVLLIGFMWIAISIGQGIPPMTICGALFVWLGYRVVFTKPVKPSLPNLKRSKVSN